MADKIVIRDLLLRTIIGINEDERTNRQNVVVTLTLETDTSTAGVSDDLGDTVNYSTLTKQIVDLVENSRFFLIERLAEEIARVCLRDPRVEGILARVEKPRALRLASSVGVEIHRTRECH